MANKIILSWSHDFSKQASFQIFVNDSHIVETETMSYTINSNQINFKLME